MHCWKTEKKQSLMWTGATVSVSIVGLASLVSDQPPRYSLHAQVKVQIHTHALCWQIFSIWMSSMPLRKGWYILWTYNWFDLMLYMILHITLYSNLDHCCQGNQRRFWTFEIRGIESQFTISKQSRYTASTIDLANLDAIILSMGSPHIRKRTWL